MREVLAQYNEDNKNMDKNYSIPIMIPEKEGVKWIELYTAKINYNGTSADFITFLNITERIIAEKEIRYLAYHDKLTGLYNRGFFEEEVNRIDVDRSLPISIIISDLNGLKLTNDVFGHLQGDKQMCIRDRE